ncbi:MAG TPA: NAD(P)H-hydrate dehydratase [Streptosporangiaceae bacterium]|nr:NAD(P)H-hydrate dehydratase [Streptosporangiaceae bacterium]
MRNAHQVAAVRAAEHELMAKLPAGVLMQRAAAGLASVCASLLGEVYGSPVVVIAGSGDNGGDALYAAARLAGRGAAVTAIAAGPKLHEAAAAELVARGGRITPAAAQVADGPAGYGDGKTGPADGGAIAPPAAHTITPAAAHAIAAAELIIDGVTGIGGHGGLREPAASLARLIARARDDGAVVVAVDVPSGIDSDTGEVHGGAVQADVTVTFGTIKPGLLIDPGASMAGLTELIDIGLANYLRPPAVVSMQAGDVAAVLPRPQAESDKYRRGVLGLVAGSDQYTGAAVLSCGGAIHGGAGMVRFVSAEVAVGVVRQHWPEAVLTAYHPDRPADAIKTAGRVQAWAVGPGIGTGPDAAALLAAVLASDVPVLVDADGLTVLAERRDLLRRDAPVLITPHAGELARLLSADRGDIEARRLHYVRVAAAELGVTVLLKGSTTVIASPDDTQPVLVNSTGTSWLATAGSGDVLSGLAGSLLAQGIPAAIAAAAAAYLHGMAGRLAARDAPIGASDLISAIPAAIRAVTSNTS